MRGLVVCCFVIASLAFGGSLEAYTKTYNYTNRALVHSWEPFTNNHLVYGVCEDIKDNEGERKCKIYQESILNNTQAAQSCNLNLKYTHGACGWPNVYLIKGSKNYVVAAVYGNTNRKTKLITLNMNSCNVEETSIETDTNSQVTIIPEDDNYHVVFKNNTLVEDDTRKATYDYDGNIVKAATVFNGITPTTFDVKYDARGYLVAEHRPSSGRVDVYFVPSDDQHDRVLFSTPDDFHGDIWGWSTEQNKLSFCLILVKKVQCQQYDAEGKTKILTMEYPISSSYQTVNSLDVLNLEKGLLVVTIEHKARSNGQLAAIIVRCDEQGNLIKSLNIDLNCTKDGHFTLLKLFINSIGEYCVASVCRNERLNHIEVPVFTRTTKCFAKSELA